MDSSSSDDFDQVGGMFDDEEQFPIHETLQRADLDMFAFETQQTTQS